MPLGGAPWGHARGGVRPRWAHVAEPAGEEPHHAALERACRNREPVMGAASIAARPLLPALQTTLMTATPCPALGSTSAPPAGEHVRRQRLRTWAAVHAAQAACCGGPSSASPPASRRGVQSRPALPSAPQAQPPLPSAPTAAAWAAGSAAPRLHRPDPPAAPCPHAHPARPPAAGTRTSAATSTTTTAPCARCTPCRPATPPPRLRRSTRCGWVKCACVCLGGGGARRRPAGATAHGPWVCRACLWALP